MAHTFDVTSSAGSVGPPTIDAAGTSTDDARIRVRIAITMSAMMCKNFAGAMNASLAMAIVVAATLYYYDLLKNGLDIWAACLIGYLPVGVAFAQGYRLGWPFPQESAFWPKSIAWGGVIAAILWGSLAFFIGPDKPPSFETLALVGLTAVIVGSAVGLATHLPTMFAFSGTLLLTAVAGLVIQGDAAHFVLAVMLAVVGVASLMFGANYNRSFAQELLLSEQNKGLVAGLQQTNQALEASNEARLRFLASASHDLRQPMHALGLFAAALDGAVSNGNDRRLYDRLIASVRSMESLIDELLGISRLEANVIQPRPQPTELQVVFDELSAVFGAAQHDRPVKLSFVRTRAVVHTDAALLHRLLSNLIGNALRYTTEGRVLVGCRRQEKKLRIDVIDTGPGIPREEWERIFLEFVQLHNPERDRTKGLGLGLAIVKRIAVLLDTSVTMDSRLGSGSRFSVALPLAEATPLQQPPEKREPVQALQGTLIVAIDDVQDIRDGLEVLFKQWGVFVVTAASGQEAIDRLDEETRLPDAIICDLRLRNNENGIDTVRRIRQHLEEEIPALLISGDTATASALEAQEQGFNLLHKPLSADKLRRELISIIQDGSVTQAEKATF